jgi:hypothetical protein
VHPAFGLQRASWLSRGLKREVCACLLAGLTRVAARSVAMIRARLGLESEPVTEQLRHRFSLHVTGAFYPFAVHRGCPGDGLVLAVKLPLCGESYVVCATAANSPRSHARSSRVTSGTPCRRETRSKWGQDSRLVEKLLRTVSQFLKVVPTILSTEPGLGLCPRLGRPHNHSGPHDPLPLVRGLLRGC